MRLIFLRSDDKYTKRWLQRHNIKLSILEHILTAVIAKESPAKKDYMYDIDIVIDKEYSSGYYFGVPELHISSQACNYKTRENKLKAFLTNTLHEFCHWMQDKILHVKGEELDYTTTDIVEESSKYWDNKHEIQARGFEAKYVDKCYNLYIALEAF